MRGKPSSEATPKMAKETPYCTRKAPQKLRRNAKKTSIRNTISSPKTAKRFWLLL
jgi:hypothetical protein